MRRTLLPIFMRRIRVEGIEHVPTHGPYLIAANHQSYTDPVQIAFPIIVLRNRKAWFLTTEHIWRAFRKFGGTWVLRWLGMIPILDSQKADALAPARSELERGGVVGIFPEGGRNKPSVNPDWERVLLKGKTGAARLALATGVPVIPAGIIAPRGFTAWQAIRGFFSRKEPAVVRYGAPLMFGKRDPSTVTKEELYEVTRTIMRAIGTLSGKHYPESY